jgi:NLI interacting factor-like phosphatase.
MEQIRVNDKIPLIVDLDHTLIDTDLLYKSSVAVLKKSPWLILLYPFWFAKGKGYLKAQLVKRFSIDAQTLPYIQDTIDYIVERKKQGSEIILATASHKDYAFEVVKHFQTHKNNETVINNKQNFDLFSDKSQTLKNNPTNSSLFDDVMASNSDFNLSSHNKAQKLIERFGKKQFDYMGDHMRDLPVWEASNLSILVNVSDKVIKKTQHLNTLILSRKN